MKKSIGGIFLLTVLAVLSCEGKTLLSSEDSEPNLYQPRLNGLELESFEVNALTAKSLSEWDPDTLSADNFSRPSETDIYTESRFRIRWQTGERHTDRVNRFILFLVEDNPDLMITPPVPRPMELTVKKNGASLRGGSPVAAGGSLYADQISSEGDIVTLRNLKPAACYYIFLGSPKEDLRFYPESGLLRERKDGEPDSNGEDGFGFLSGTVTFPSLRHFSDRIRIWTPAAVFITDVYFTPDNAGLVVKSGKRIDSGSDYRLHLGNGEIHRIGTGSTETRISLKEPFRGETLDFGIEVVDALGREPKSEDEKWNDAEVSLVRFEKSVRPYPSAPVIGETVEMLPEGGAQSWPAFRFTVTVDENAAAYFQTTENGMLPGTEKSGSGELPDRFLNVFRQSPDDTFFSPVRVENEEDDYTNSKYYYTYTPDSGDAARFTVTVFYMPPLENQNWYVTVKNHSNFQNPFLAGEENNLRVQESDYSQPLTDPVNAEG